MGKSKDLATGNSAFYQDQTESDARYVNTAGDAMTGNLGVGGAAHATYAITSHSSGGANLRLDNDGEIGFINLNDDGDLNIWAHGDENISFLNGTGSGTERVNIDGSGRVTMPSQPSFAAFRDAGHVTSGSVYIFDHTVYNDGNMYNTSNGRGTAPVAGKYLVSVWLMTTTTSTFNNKYYAIRKNGGHYRRVYSSSGGNLHHQQSWTGIIYLNANDYIEIYNSNTGLYGTSSYYSNFNMHLLS